MKSVQEYFSMSQLWQSLLITAAIGGTLLLGSLVLADRNEQEAEPITAATTTPAYPAAAVEAFGGMNLSGQAAIVLDLSTGETLYSENADTALPLASLTKLLTAYAAQTVLTPQSSVPITTSSLAAEGESGLYEGESFAFSDLASFMLVSSSNDGAEAIAEAAAAELGVTKEELFRRAADRAGLGKTRAVNGSGLDVDLVQSGGYGSARDVAKLAGALLRESPDIARSSIFSNITVYSDAGMPHSLPNTNPYTGNVPGLLLSKTGFTDLAGGNLAVVFDAGIGHPVAVVVLGSTREGRFADVRTLVEATRAHFAGIAPLY